jgi:hypothetical protein
MLVSKYSGAAVLVDENFQEILNKIIIKIEI